MAAIKRDDVKQKWEETEFPLVCETCLGDNPYVRMTKEPFGKKCRVCEIPMTVFAWQAGTKGRLKKVEICKNCAKTKNVCQVCVFDLQYGLPVALRDKVLSEHGGGTAGLKVPPQSDANLSWFAQSTARAIENGTALGAGVVPEAAAVELGKMARMEPRYERNLPKICSFFARGECNRGSTCPFRHEVPKDRNDPLSKQNTKDRFYGTNDPVAGRILAKAKEREEKRREESAARDEEDGEGTTTTTTLYVRFGDSDDNHPPIPTETHLRDAFYSYGEILAVRFPKTNTGAFVEYSSRNATQLAITSTGKISIHGRVCFVNWARAPKRGNTTITPNNMQHAANNTAKPLPPPGTANAHTMPHLSGFVPQRPPSAVTAAANAMRSSLSSNRSNLGSVPRPGGGVIRGGARSAAPKPYYPSQDPSRLGSRTN